MNNLFLKIDNINGDSKDANHVGWIDIKSYSWGTTRKISGSSTVFYKNLSINAIQDKSVPAILLSSSNGNKIRKVELSACKAGGTQMEFCKITLENVMIVEVALHDSGYEPALGLEFQADRVKIQFWEQSEMGTKGAETRSGWDIKNNTSFF